VDEPSGSAAVDVDQSAMDHILSKAAAPDIQNALGEYEYN
jgi:hypothetical protein